MSVLYIYNKNSGAFLYEDSAGINTILEELGEDKGVTDARPPDYENIWRWIVDKWVADEPELPPQKPIEELQLEVWEAIKQRRLQAITSGIHVASVDKVFHTDNLSAIQYSTVAGMIALGNYQPIPWKVMDNTWLMLSEEVFKDLQTAMSAHTNNAYAVAEQHKEAMMQAEDPLNYDFSSGWDYPPSSN